MPNHLQGKIREAMAFKQSISKPLPPGVGSRCFVIYGAKHTTTTEATVQRSSSGITGKITADHQGGDATVPKESGRGEILWPAGCEVTRDNGAEHFMLTETPTVQMILETNLARGDT